MADSTDVRIVISAITEAAQQAIDEVADDISGIADDAAIGQTALDQLGDELGESAGRAEVLQAALEGLQDEERDAAIATAILQQAQDELGDEMTESAAKTAANTAALQANSAAASSASGSFGLLSTTMILSLIPAVLTAATVLAPVAVLLGAIAAGAVALAGAFGLIVGSGILAFGQQRAEQNKERLEQVNQQVAALERLKNSESGLTKVQQRRLDRLKEEQEELKDSTTATGALQQVMGDLKDELVPLITEFGEEFVPLIEDTIQAIPTLVRNMLDAVGGTESFEQALRRFGAILMDVLPALVGLMFDLARVALPVLEDFVAFLQGNGDDALSAMQESLQELTPEFQNFLDALIEMAPVLLEFGTNAGEVLIPALTGLIRAATGFMAVINRMPEPLQKLTISVLLLMPLLVKFSGLFSALIPSAFTLGKAFGLLQAAAGAVAGSTAAVVAAAVALGAAIGLAVVKVLDMVGVLDAVGEAGEAFASFFGEDAVDAILTFLSVITLGIFPALAALGGLIVGLVRGDLDRAVENAKDILGTFGDAFVNTGEMITDFLAGLGESFIQFFTQTLPSAFMSFISFVVSGFVQFFTQTLPRVATQGLGAFVALIEQQFNRIFNVVAGIWNGLVELVADATERLINAGINAINSFLSTLDNVGDKIGEIPGVDGVDVGTLDEVSVNRNIGQVDRRETNFDTLRQQRTQQAQTVVQGGINVDVDTGDFGRNPRRDSRTFANQLRREVRNENGAN